jgi:hypothetical protein
MTDDLMPCPEPWTPAAPPKDATPRQRAEHVVKTLPALGTSDAHLVVAVLSAALDPEELAREFYRRGAWCGECDKTEGWHACPGCRSVCRGYAIGLRDFALRGPA